MRATAKLRQLLQEPGIIMAPGAYDCLTAKIIEQSDLPFEIRHAPGPRP